MREKLAFVHVFILVYMVEAGLILFRFPQLEAEYFGTNGWISLLLCFFLAAGNILLISFVHKMAQGRSIFAIMEQTVSRFLLIPVYLVLITVWGSLASLAAKEYVHILKMVSFPTVVPATFVITIGFISYYLYTKGIYNIVKAASIFFLLSVWMTLLLLYFYDDFQISRMTPFLFRGSHHMVIGFLNIYSAYLGYELVLLMIPYADRKTKLVKAAFWATLSASLLYLYVGIICFGVFSQEQLKLSLFPVLDLLAVIKFPFMERIENLFYGFFLFSNIVSTVAYYWAASQVGRRIIPRLNEKLIGLWIILIFASISLVPNTLMETETWLRNAGYAGFGVAIGLPVLLIGLLLVQKKKGGPNRDQT